MLDDTCCTFNDSKLGQAMFLYSIETEMTIKMLNNIFFSLNTKKKMFKFITRYIECI